MSGNCCFTVIQTVIYHPTIIDAKAFYEHMLAEYSDAHKEDVKDIQVEFGIIQANVPSNNQNPMFYETENYKHFLEKVPAFIYTAQIDADQQPE